MAQQSRLLQSGREGAIMSSCPATKHFDLVCIRARWLSCCLLCLWCAALSANLVVEIVYLQRVLSQAHSTSGTYLTIGSVENVLVWLSLAMLNLIAMPMMYSLWACMERGSFKGLLNVARRIRTSKLFIDGVNIHKYKGLRQNASRWYIPLRPGAKDEYYSPSFQGNVQANASERSQSQNSESQVPAVQIDAQYTQKWWYWWNYEKFATEVSPLMKGIMVTTGLLGPVLVGVADVWWFMNAHERLPPPTLQRLIPTLYEVMVQGLDISEDFSYQILFWTGGVLMIMFSLIAGVSAAWYQANVCCRAAQALSCAIKLLQLQVPLIESLHEGNITDSTPTPALAEARTHKLHARFVIGVITDFQDSMTRHWSYPPAGPKGCKGMFKCRASTPYSMIGAIVVIMGIASFAKAVIAVEATEKYLSAESITSLLTLLTCVAVLLRLIAHLARMTEECSSSQQSLHHHNNEDEFHVEPSISTALEAYCRDVNMNPSYDDWSPQLQRLTTSIVGAEIGPQLLGFVVNNGTYVKVVQAAITIIPSLYGLLVSFAGPKDKYVCSTCTAQYVNEETVQWLCQNCHNITTGEDTATIDVPDPFDISHHAY